MKDIHLGLDFDNTIVIYDQLFYDYALKCGYIDKGIEKNKVAIRKELIENNQEDIFTKMQGVVYGKLIVDAPIQNAMADSIRNIIKMGAKVSIVSHKTKYPIIGERLDLHKASMQWLHKNGFFDNSKIGIKETNVFFEESIEKKISRIHEIGCTHFVDDLEKVLVRLNDDVDKIQFGCLEKDSKYKVLSKWKDLKMVILN